MESSVNGGFSQLQSCGDSSEEELSVLPRHTKVVVTGNNRTKSVLVGLQGVVKKAVGLGGWHWLVNYSTNLLYNKNGSLYSELPASNFWVTNVVWFICILMNSNQCLVSVNLLYYFIFYIFLFLFRHPFNHGQI